MAWLIRVVVIGTLFLGALLAVPEVRAQSCPPQIEVENYRESRITEVQRIQLGRILEREYRAVCQQQTGRPRLKSFKLFPDEFTRVPTQSGGTAIPVVTDGIHFYTVPNSPEGGFIGIKGSAAQSLLRNGSTTLLRREINRSFGSGAPATTGGDEDVEEGAPVDGSPAAGAAGGTGCVQRGRLIPSNPENCTVGDIAALITQAVLPFFLNIAGGIAIIMILWGAFQYFTAYGDPQKIDAGKKTLTWAIVGLVVIIAARAIITYSCEFFASDENRQDICNVEVRQ